MCVEGYNPKSIRLKRKKKIHLSVYSESYVYIMKTNIFYNSLKRRTSTTDYNIFHIQAALFDLDIFLKKLKHIRLYRLITIVLNNCHLPSITMYLSISFRKKVQLKIITIYLFHAIWVSSMVSQCHSPSVSTTQHTKEKENNNK